MSRKATIIKHPCPHCNEFVIYSKHKAHFKDYHSDKDIKQYRLFLMEGKLLSDYTCECGCGRFIYPNSILRIQKIIVGHHKQKTQNRTCPHCDLKISTYGVIPHYEKFHKDKNFNEYALFVRTGSMDPKIFCLCGCGGAIYPNKRMEMMKYIDHHHVRKMKWKPSTLRKRRQSTVKRNCPCCLKKIGRKEIRSHYFKFHTNDINEEKFRTIYYEPRTTLCACGCGNIACVQWSGRLSSYVRGHSIFTDKFSDKISKLEIKFSKILDRLKIEYEQQFQIMSYNIHMIKFYDFKIKNKNVLIEIDGDYWHFNPKFYPDNICNQRMQKKKNGDKFKNRLAKQRGYMLLRFWENDINNNTPTFKRKIKMLQSLIK